MATKSQFISDVELQILQSSPSDDTEVSKEHIAFIGSYFLNAFIAQECNSKLARGEQIPSVYITRATIEVPEIESTDHVSDLDERIFVEIPEVLSLNNDGGVIVIQKVNIQSNQIFKKMRFTKPTADNLTYYRAGNRLYINGLTPTDVDFTYILLDYVPKQDLTSMSDDDNILCTDLVYPQVVGATTQEMIKMLYGTEQDVANDGQDVKAPRYHNVISDRSQSPE